VTLRTRLAVAAALGVLVVVGLVSVVLYLSYAASLRARVDADLVNTAQQTSSIAQKVKQSAATDGGTPDITKPVTVGSTEIQLFPGPVAVGQPTQFGPLGSRDIAVADHTDPAYFADASAGGIRSRVYTAAIPDADSGGLVRVSRALDADEGALRNAALLLTALTVVAAGLTYALARLFAGRVLRPVGDLTAAAEHVTRTQDLSARLGVRGTDEIGRLGASFDAMLAALDESATAQRQLVADASHELRTPLTSLITNLELLEDGRGVADPQAPTLVRAARDQASELDDLVTDLLDLARYRESSPHREETRLDLLVLGVIDRMRHRCRVQADLRACVVDVDPAAVERAVANLIDNAVKWSAPDDPVHVTVAGGRVTVTDHGPGIAEQDLPHIFERFYRAPAARGMPGAGLGLAIVGQVATAHHASVTVDTGPQGSSFVLAF
jgi:two-component system sensor histidine kinase MprB